LKLLFPSLLFLSLLAAFLLIFLPLNEYDIAIAVVAKDSLNSIISAKLFSDYRQRALRIINKSTRDLLRTGIISGIFLGIIVSLLTVKFLGAFCVVLGFIGFIMGLSLTGKLIENEFLKWQANILAGIPALMNFVPAFLEVESVTPREALAQTIPFLPDPLNGEISEVVTKIQRTGDAPRAFAEFADKVNHPLVDAVCFRLSASWDAKITPEVFSDLSDQVEGMFELAVSRSTAAKTGYLALISVLGLLGMLLEFGYPGIKFLISKMAGGLF